jgi:hypothetical protein
VLLLHGADITCVVFTITWVDPEREASLLKGDIKVNIQVNVRNLVTEVRTLSTETNQENVVQSQGEL